ncbi:MarR family winged helix-turn-helix transcriptional regulator [Curtobacterium flaccumfaciens]|uniref:MarR family winged helix-turn-helix transcriptional regulator n=1 Tax=Curtobacterium flaccumfaciens TaxID=2035 RepID=UPI00160173CD|nr:MarR family transcriptional regulator [Curtobacterium flaccumfaciens]MBB1198611.1 MarR family transcriptional regulator [Curtobacterium flaccumfaciens]
MPAAPSGTPRDDDRLLDDAVAAFYAAQVEHAHLIQHLAVAHDLNPVDLRALKFLGALDEDRTPKELGSYLEMGTGAVTALLDRLTRRGFLDRVRNPSDRRSVRIELSANGFAIVGALRSAYREALQRSLPGESMQIFIDFSGKIAVAFADIATEDPQ